MTVSQIQARLDVERLKFETAKQVRELLDAARQVAENAGEDADDFETAILELVTEVES